MMSLDSITPVQLVIGGVAISFLLADNMDAEHLNVFGNLIVAVGSIMLTMAAQQQFLASKEKKS